MLSRISFQISQELKVGSSGMCSRAIHTHTQVYLHVHTCTHTHTYGKATAQILRADSVSADSCNDHKAPHTCLVSHWACEGSPGLIQRAAQGCDTSTGQVRHFHRHVLGELIPSKGTRCSCSCLRLE